VVVELHIPSVRGREVNSARLLKLDKKLKPSVFALSADAVLMYPLCLAKKDWPAA
jgi:hypothetical protein